MSNYRERDLLREQEKTLVQLHMNFSDQLNRLKIEELALTNLLRLQKEKEMQAQTGASDENMQMGPVEEAVEDETMQALNLLVSNDTTIKGEAEEEEGEEEEEDADDYNLQLSSFLQDLLHQQKQHHHAARGDEGEGLEGEGLEGEGLEGAGEGLEGAGSQREEEGDLT